MNWYMKTSTWEKIKNVIMSVIAVFLAAVLVFLILCLTEKQTYRNKTLYKSDVYEHDNRSYQIEITDKTDNDAVSYIKYCVTLTVTDNETGEEKSTLLYSGSMGSEGTESFNVNWCEEKFRVSADTDAPNEYNADCYFCYEDF